MTVLRELETDVIVVGGGTAGCIVAARVSENPELHTTLLEWGPTDQGEDRARYVRRWLEMLEGEYDLDYRSVPQARGNSGIQQSRARILGGCANHNTMIAFRPPVWDLDEWVAEGAVGWDAASFFPYYERLKTTIVPVAEPHRNAYLKDVIAAASKALEIPVQTDWNRGEWTEGAGFLSIAYRPETGERSTSSRDYIHPLIDARDNLDLRLGARVTRLIVDAGRVTGVEVTRDDGSRERITARREVVLCAGSIDTPRLMLLSGIGPAEALKAAGVDVSIDLPGVGQNLMDHPEALLVWETTRPIPPEGATDWDIGILVKTDTTRPGPDVMMHVPLATFAVHAETAGIATPEDSVSMTPNVTKPKSRGTLRLASPDPEVAPLYDPAYLTDCEGYDERMLLRGVELARQIAATEPMAGWLLRETVPGPDCTKPDELREMIRTTHHTVYHISGTCKMGAADDVMAVCDPQLRVRGVRGLRVADASVFPTITTINPMITIFMIAERAADLIVSDPS